MTGHDVLTAIGIVVVVLGLAGLRALFWVRRVKSMTEIGRSLHEPGPPEGSADGDRIG